MIPEPWRGGLVVVDAVAAFRDGPIASISPADRVAPAKPGIGYHTSTALASAPVRVFQRQNLTIFGHQIIAIPPLTWSVWPVT
jgi:hypothetical protein